MARAIGIGGVFFKSPDPVALGNWYREVLGVPYDDGIGVGFPIGDAPAGSYAVWSPFPADTDYFGPGPAGFMVNLMVDDLDGVIRQITDAGSTIAGGIDEYEYGRFAWFLDPDGNKVELWEPAQSDEQEGDSP